MSWSLVQFKAQQFTAGPFSTVNLTFTSAVTAGNLVAAVVPCYGVATGASDSVNSVAYTLGSSYGGSGGGGDRSYIYWYVPPVGGTGFKITATGTSFYPILVLAEFTWGPGSTYLADGTPTSSPGTSAAPAAGSITPTASDLFIGCMSYSTATTRAANTPLTELFGANYSSGTIGGSVSYALNQSSAANPSWAMGGSTNWAAAGIAFKATGGGGGGFTPWIYGDQIEANAMG